MTPAPEIQWGDMCGWLVLAHPRQRSDRDDLAQHGDLGKASWKARLLLQS